LAWKGGGRGPAKKKKGNKKKLRRGEAFPQGGGNAMRKEARFSFLKGRSPSNRFGGEEKVRIRLSQKGRLKRSGTGTWKIGNAETLAEAYKGRGGRKKSIVGLSSHERGLSTVKTRRISIGGQRNIVGGGKHRTGGERPASEISPITNYQGEREYPAGAGGRSVFFSNKRTLKAGSTREKRRERIKPAPRLRVGY